MIGPGAMERWGNEGDRRGVRGRLRMVCDGTGGGFAFPPGPDGGENGFLDLMARTAALMLVCFAALLAGCSQLGPMPDLMPGKVMSKDEQQSKVDGMIERGQSHEHDAEKQIEADK